MARLIDVYPYRKMREQYEFLIFRRAPGTIYEGQWRMVGGKVEDDETAWQAALRELKEETNQVPVCFWTIPSINHFYDYHTDRIEYIPAFAAELDPQSKISLNREHDAYKWIEYSQIDSIIIWPEQQRLLTLVHSILTTYKPQDDWKISF